MNPAANDAGGRPLLWHTSLGVALYIGLMAAAYSYNLTFVQLGLPDLGTRVIGLAETTVAMSMGVLAAITCVVAIATGALMRRRAWGRDLRVKLRIIFFVVLAQTVLTAIAPLLHTAAQFWLWIIFAAVVLGVGVPATFSMAVDLVPVRWRGHVAAVITALAYFIAAVFLSPWRVELFAGVMLWLMAFGTLALGAFVFGMRRFIDALALQSNRPSFAIGRFVRVDANGHAKTQRRILGFVVALFAIFFIDSLGFLRLTATPAFMLPAWQSPNLAPRLFIGVTHVVAALIAGVLYAALDERALFGWVFALFALAHLMYGLDLRIASSNAAPLAMPMVYAAAVSLYTVINFAVWADVSTPATAGVRTGIGVALSGWTATFISTALAMLWRVNGMPLAQHLNIVGAVAMLAFLAVLVMAYARPAKRAQP